MTPPSIKQPYLSRQTRHGTQNHRDRATKQTRNVTWHRNTHLPRRSILGQDGVQSHGLVGRTALDIHGALREPADADADAKATTDQAGEQRGGGRLRTRTFSQLSEKVVNIIVS